MTRDAEEFVAAFARVTEALRWASEREKVTVCVNAEALGLVMGGIDAILCEVQSLRTEVRRVKTRLEEMP